MGKSFRNLVLHNQYSLSDEIGEGNLGILYRGTDQKKGESVLIYALDLNDQNQEEKWAERFQNTALLLRTLAHPNLARVLQVDKSREQNLVYTVVNHLPGKTLRQVLDDNRKIEMAKAFQITGQLAQAIHYLHQHSLIHGSLSPETVIVDVTLQNAVLWDLSLATGGPSGALPAETLTSRFGYTSPEQMRGKGIDPRSDIYLLGFVLYEMLAGRPLFDVKDPDIVKVYHRSTPPASIQQLCADLGSEEANLIMTMLAKTPDERPPNLEVVVNVLQIPDLQTITNGSEIRPAAELEGQLPPIDMHEPSKAQPGTQLIGEGGKQYFVPISKTDVLIGRQDPSSDSQWHPDIDLSREPNSRTVSRRHALLKRGLEGWRLVPIEGANPTVVDQQLVNKSGQFLFDGDRVQLGLVKLVFRDK